jgi:hypothetical protein
MGIDFGQTGNTGMGGGFGVVVTVFEDGIVKVLAAKLWVNSEYNEVLRDIRSMNQDYDPVKISTISNPNYGPSLIAVFINGLKILVSVIVSWFQMIIVAA